jgi:cellulose synthase/poly-beta-1,6-N-acetylglucosamine synthase-like glycosyltransferase
VIIATLLCTALLGMMLAVALLNLLTAPRLGRGDASAGHPSVSLLVPARDEAENLRRTLPSLLAQDQPGLEILLLDDRSRDGTAAAARRIAGADGSRLRVMRGTEPPSGWAGKNWACHQLSEAATGEVLLFCDADVEAAPGAVRATLAAMRAHRADALTALPRQRMDGWMQAAVVPVVAQLPGLALLPLRLIPLLRAPSLSMANGQWLAFTRAAYGDCGGHAAVRGEVLEDVALGRRVKASGGRLVACVAPDLLAVRMYASAREMRAGFRKNLYPLLGGRPLPFVLVTGMLGFAWLFPFAAAAGNGALAFAPLILLAALRIVGMLLFRHGWRTAVAHPLGVACAAVLAVESWRDHRRGRVRWKGRTVPGSTASSDG